MRYFLALTLLCAAQVFAQVDTPAKAPVLKQASNGTSDVAKDQPSASPAPSNDPAAPGSADATPAVKSAEAPSASKQQPKRILGMMPNYRTVSAGEVPLPPSPGQAFKLATHNSFDYSSFVFVGLTSAMAEASNAHPKFGKGMNGFGRYYWHGFVDKVDGNYLVIFALPTVFHQDERYYALGKGGFAKRLAYAASRIAITPNYQGHNSFNASELLGRGIAQGISTTYYPGSDRTAGALATKYAYALMRDALTNAFREFWPDIATHVLHRNPQSHGNK